MGGDKCQAWDKVIIALGWQRRNGSFCAVGAEGRAEEDGGAWDGREEQPWLPSSRAAPSRQGQQKVLTRGGGCEEWGGVKGNRHGVPLCKGGPCNPDCPPLCGRRRETEAERGTQQPEAQLQDVCQAVNAVMSPQEPPLLPAQPGEPVSRGTPSCLLMGMHACALTPVPGLGTNASCLSAPQQTVCLHKDSMCPRVPLCPVGDVESPEAAQMQRKPLDSSSSTRAVLLVSPLGCGVGIHQARPVLTAFPASQEEPAPGGPPGSLQVEAMLRELGELWEDLQRKHQENGAVLREIDKVHRGRAGVGTGACPNPAACWGLASEASAHGDWSCSISTDISG